MKLKFNYQCQSAYIHDIIASIRDKFGKFNISNHDYTQVYDFKHEKGAIYACECTHSINDAFVSESVLDSILEVEKQFGIKINFEVMK